MGYDVVHWLRAFVVDYGYWAVAAALLCENAGLPVPGETTLLIASFLAYSEHRLNLGWIIVVATCAATLGDNFGFTIGSRGGRPLLDRYQHVFRIPQRSLERGEAMFALYGPATIFFARFIFGMRVFAGPLAGVLRMPWRAFAFFNFLGAIVWVAVIASAGYLFGRHWQLLVAGLRRLDITVMALAAVVVLILWWQSRSKTGTDG
jgi:membrane protein DedA with SNARE-associated domain